MSLFEVMWSDNNCVQFFSEAGIAFIELSLNDISFMPTSWHIYYGNYFKSLSFAIIFCNLLIFTMSEKFVTLFLLN